MKLATLITSAVIAAASVTGSAAAASGQNEIKAHSFQDSHHPVRLYEVNAADNGYIEIIDYYGGKKGKILGLTAIEEGMNKQVRVQVSSPTFRDMIAVLYDANGNPVASKKLVIEEN